MSDCKSPLPRQKVLEEHTWNLKPLFKSDAAWEKAFKKAESELPAIGVFKGKLSKSAAKLLACCRLSTSIHLNLEKIGAYAQLKYAEDITNPLYQGMVARFSRLAMLASEAESYINPEIQAIPRKIMDGYLKDPILAEYKALLKDLLRYRPHVLTPAEERLLAMQGEVSEAPSKIFDQLTDGDLVFGTVTDENGKESALTQSSFVTFLESPKRSVRKEAFEKYYQVFESHKYSLASILNASLLQDIYYARARNFPSARESALFADRLPVSVYDSLITAVRDGLPSVHRYYALRKRVLRLKDIHFYDTYQPLVKGMSVSIPYEEAVETICDAMGVLGNDYVGALRKGLTADRWVDRYENRGKISGAYSSGCYDSPPYILLNYDNTINSLYTLIHESGHSMHSYFSRKYQPYVYHEYTIFVAEVASTLNEMLLSHYLLNKYQDNPLMQAYILNREIDEIRGTLFRQTMFAEFEFIIHTMAENNQPLTYQALTEAYAALLQKYFASTIVIDPELHNEYLRIPHFYSAFYVYKYATGIAAALSLAQMILSSDDGAKKYMQFLRLGGSMFPLEELKIAGVDMESPDVIVNALHYFDNLVNTFIQAHRSLT